MLSEPLERQSDDHHPASMIGPNAPRALVVDDEKMVRLLVARALAAQQIACDTASDGDEAARMLAESRYDIVITDLRMPNRNGHALCQSILEHTDRPLLVVLTALAEPRLFRDLEARGVDLILQKPIDLSFFGRKIRALIGARRGDGLSGSPEGDVADQSLIETAPPAEAARLPTVAILTADKFRSEKLAGGLGGGINVFVPETTDALWRFVDGRHLDVLLIELAQYGFLDGAEILVRLQGSSAPPQAVAIGEGDQFSPEQIQTLNIRKIFPREASDSDLVQFIRSMLVNIERIGRIPPEARALVRSFGAPACSPAVLLNLTQYLEIEPTEVPVDRLARDIVVDPATTAELLRLVNASSYGVRRQITEVSEALNLLGTTRAVSLLLSSAMRHAEGRLLHSLPPDLRTWYQLRTILIASVASVFAERHFGLSGDTAFVLGLFQDMGILVLASSFGDKYLRLIAHARSVGPVRLHAIEQHYFRINHAEVSAALVELWRLPELLVRPIRQHHETGPPSGAPNESTAFIRPMRIGEAFANLWDNRHPTRMETMSRLLAECPHGQDADYQESLAQAVRRTADIAQLFLVPQPNETAALAVCNEILSAYVESRKAGIFNEASTAPVK